MCVSVCVRVFACVCVCVRACVFFSERVRVCFPSAFPAVASAPQFMLGMHTTTRALSMYAR